jgi:hypothetical protein
MVCLAVPTVLTVLTVPTVLTVLTALWYMPRPSVCQVCGIPRAIWRGGTGSPSLLSVHERSTGHRCSHGHRCFEIVAAAQATVLLGGRYTTGNLAGRGGVLVRLFAPGAKGMPMFFRSKGKLL